MKNKVILFLALTTCCFLAHGQVSIKQAKGWFESAYITWDLYNGADMYNVYVKKSGAASWTQLDEELIRNYGWYGRADALGLAAGNYQFKVEAVKSGSVIAGSAAESGTVAVASYDRAGFAHKDGDAVGAYNSDGTLKANARVLYITNENIDNVTLTVMQDKEDTEFTGLGNILKAFEKGKETRPLAIRFIGDIQGSSQLYGDADAMQLKGKNNTIAQQVTFEGVGEDATLSDFGLVFNKANNVEVRNLGFMNFNDDGISIKSSVKLWVHNCDIFYGKKGSASDQAKGDGSLDVKDDSQYCTFSYLHFWDSGKMSLCGMKSESGPNYISYHHNWFDHSDSRHPRVRTMTVHVWNNYYDGVSKYGVGVTTGSSVFVENNYFRNTNRPMMSSLQGTDATGDGTFSGESGGMIKSYGNLFVETGSNFSYITANAVEGSGATEVNATSFDAYHATTRDEKVPDTYETLSGGTPYNNFDTDASLMYAYTPDAAIDVPAKVQSSAGRMFGGDFSWSNFDNSTDDADYDVNTALQSAINNYETSLVEIAAFTKIFSAPATYTVTYYADTEGTVVFETMTGQTKIVYPQNTPTKDGYTFVGWSVIQGTVLTSDMIVFPSFSDGVNSTGGSTSGGGTVEARKWDFTSWSSESQNAITANTAVWTIKGDGTQRYNGSFSSETDLGFAETEDLLFKGSVLVSFDSSKEQYIQGSCAITVPVTAGQTITVQFSNTGSSNGSRDLTIDGAVIASSSNTTKTTGNYTVPAGVTSVVLKGSGSLNYYTIRLTEEAGALEKPEFAYSAVAYQADMAAGATNVWPTLTNNSDGEVTYRSSNRAVATVSAAGAITLQGMGTTTITASVAATGNFAAATASYLLTVINSDIQSYTVTFMNGEEVFAVMENQYTVVYPTDEPQKDGYMFMGWDVPAGTTLTSDLTVNAVWKAIPTYTVTFMVDGKEYETMYNQTVVVYPATNPVKDGFVFDGWDVEEGTILTKDLTVNGSFSEAVSGDIVIEAGTFPSGYTLDGAASGSLYTYSDDTQAAKLISLEDGGHTVALPAGIKVTQVIFEGCTQNNEPKGNLTNFNGTTVSYNFVSRKTTPFTQIKFEDLDITGSFTFEVDYNVALRILLTVQAVSQSQATMQSFTDVENAIRFNGHEALADGLLYLYNTQGMLLKTGQESINVDNLPAGIYLVRCGEHSLKICK